MKTKERSIILRDWEIAAVLRESKTQHRVPVKPQPPSQTAVRNLSGIAYDWMSCADYGHPEDFRVAGPVWAVAKLGGPTTITSPFGAPGDALRFRGSKILVLVKRVWVERLQAIGEADSQKMGVGFPGPWSGVGGKTHQTCIDAVRVAWTYRHKPPYDWDNNPLVWCVEWELVR